MNIIKIQNQLKNAPDDALVGYVQNPTGHVPTYLALSELQRRKEMRSSYQANKPEEKSVAEDLVQESQPQMSQEGVGALPAGQPMQQAMQPPPEMPMEQMAQGGLAELDTGNMFDENNYASGGIVAFADGGDIPSYAGPYGSYVQSDDPYADMYGSDLEKAMALKQYEADKKRSPQTMPKFMMSPPTKPEQYDINSLVRKVNPIGGYVPTESPAKSDAQLLAEQNEKALRDKGKRGPNPFDTMISKEKSLKELSGEYMNILGEDKGAKKLSDRLAKMDEKAVKQEQQAPWLALAKAGFEMANTRAEYGKAAETPFASLARGAGAGIKDYAESKEALNKLEEKRFVLENELSKQARAEQVAALKYGQDSKQHTEQMNKTIQLAKIKDNTEREIANMENNTKLIAAMQKGNWDKKDYFKAYNEVADSELYKKAEADLIADKGGDVVKHPSFPQWKDETIKRIIRQTESSSGSSSGDWTNFKKSN
jgi:hypothetical protein